VAKEHFLLYKGVKYASLRYYIHIKQTGKLAVPIGEDLTLEGVTARGIADRMIEASQAKLHLERRRPNAFTGRLSRALGDPRGHDVKRNKIELFQVAFLDEHVPYWRAIDQGSVRAKGRLLSGVWTAGGVLSPWGFGPDVGGQRLFRAGASSRVGPPVGAGREGRRSRRAATAARAMLRDAGYSWQEASRVTGIIENPITAENYIEQARRSFHREDAQKLASEAMTAFFNRTKRRR
jgi:hypothetical protein